MNRVEQEMRNYRLAVYLATPRKHTEDGKPIYPTVDEAGKKFKIAASHVARIKKQLIGLDVDGIRRMPDAMPV